MDGVEEKGRSKLAPRQSGASRVFRTRATWEAAADSPVQCSHWTFPSPSLGEKPLDPLRYPYRAAVKPRWA